VTASGFAIFCFFGFLVPVPILAWLDRAKSNSRTRQVNPKNT